MRRIFLAALVAGFVGVAEAAPRRCEDLAGPKDFSNLAQSHTPAGKFAAAFLDFSRWRERRDLPNSMSRTSGAARPNPSVRMRALLQTLDLRPPDNLRVLGCAVAQTVDDAIMRSAIEVVARKAPMQLEPLAQAYVPGDPAKQAEIKDISTNVRADPSRP